MAARTSWLAVLAAGVCLGARVEGASAQAPVPASVEVHEASVVELADAMAAGRTTAAALVDAYLARIAAYDRSGSALNAVIRLNPSARAEAEALDRERAVRGPRGPLHGIPVLIKDNYEVAGLVTSNGSIAFAGWVPRTDAAVVRSLREGGAVILGMTNMHELASGITTIASAGGQTRNPYDPARNPGGSSGGTGAAVAASFAALGWGSDTCGSIRIPAAHQNLFGLRPSIGLFDTGGIFPLSHSQDVPGPLARSVTDLAIGLDATLPPSAPIRPGRFRAALDSGALRGLRVGVLTNYFGSAPEEAEVGRVLRPVLDSLKARGAQLTDVTLEVELDTIVGRGSLITLEHKWDMLDFLAERPEAEVRGLSDILSRELYHQSLQNNLRAKDTVGARTTERHRVAVAHQDSLRRLVLRALEERGVEVLVYPTVRRKPALIGEPQYGSTCGLSATTGLPAITMPAGLTNDGLPVALEALGRPLADDRLVAIAYAFEQAFRPRQPPFSTPPLAGGAAPVPVSFEVEARNGGESAVARFAYDAARSALAYDVRIEADPQAVRGLTLNALGTDGKAPVLHQLLAAGSRGAAGTLVLPYATRQALVAGRLVLVLYTDASPTGIRASLALPRASERP